MSDILTKIKADMLTARKARDTEAVKAFSTLVGEIELIGKKAGNVINDELVIATVKKFIVNLKENLEHTESPKGKADVGTEIELLEVYLPTQMTESELQDIIANLEPANMGEAMKHLKDCYTGLYDGKLASQVVKGWLA